MKIHTGDQVTVIAGKDKGKQGIVTRVLLEKSRVVVEGVNMRVRHIKKTAQAAGQRISYEASIHVSNVMILDPKTKKPTRIGYKIDPKTGHKSRIAKISGEVILKAVTKAEKPSTAKTASDKKEKAKTTEATPAKPVKQPFWKRKGDGKGNDTGTGGDTPGGSNVIQTAHRSQGG
jgi:large subunit ribosomal protein L24